MNKSAKSKDRRKASRGQLWLHLPGMVREALYDTVIGAGLACVDEVLEMERVALCGERYEHLADRQALRPPPASPAGPARPLIVSTVGWKFARSAFTRCGFSEACFDFSPYAVEQ